MTEYYTVGDAGYTCPDCGWWVPSGTLHTCGTSSLPSNWWPSLPPAKSDVEVKIEKIKRELDELLKML